MSYIPALNDKIEKQVNPILQAEQMSFQSTHSFSLFYGN